MRFKREEAFRFQFQKPLQGSIKLIKENGAAANSESSRIEIMDVSPNGIKFHSPINFAIHEKKYLLEITFELENRLLHILGEPVWKKPSGSQFTYGFNGLDNKSTKQEIIEALKDYSKRIYLETKKNMK